MIPPLADDKLDSVHTALSWQRSEKNRLSITSGREELYHSACLHTLRSSYNVFLISWRWWSTSPSLNSDLQLSEHMRVLVHSLTAVWWNLRFLAAARPRGTESLLDIGLTGAKKSGHATFWLHFHSCTFVSIFTCWWCFMPPRPKTTKVAQHFLWLLEAAKCPSRCTPVPGSDFGRDFFIRN